MILKVITNKNKLIIPEGDTGGSASTHYTNSNYIDIFYGDFFKKDGTFTKKRKQHFYVCNEIKNIIQRQIGNNYSYSELFAGIGIKAAIFCDNMNKGQKIQLNELNADCTEILKQNFTEADITCGDSFYYKFKENYDVSVIDFNNYTIGKYAKGWKTLLDNVFSHTNKFVVLNDCSIVYLSRKQDLSFETYSSILGKEIHNIDEYRSAVVDFYEKEYPDWNVMYVFICGQTDFILFEKKSLTVEGEDKEKLGGIECIDALVDKNLETPIIVTENDIFGE